MKHQLITVGITIIALLLVLKLTGVIDRARCQAVSDTLGLPAVHAGVTGCYLKYPTGIVVPLFH